MLVLSTIPCFQFTEGLILIIIILGVRSRTSIFRRSTNLLSLKIPDWECVIRYIFNLILLGWISSHYFFYIGNWYYFWWGRYRRWPIWNSYRRSGQCTWSSRRSGWRNGAPWWWILKIILYAFCAYFYFYIIMFVNFFYWAIVTLENVIFKTVPQLLKNPF